MTEVIIAAVIYTVFCVYSLHRVPEKSKPKCFSRIFIMIDQQN